MLDFLHSERNSTQDDKTMFTYQIVQDFRCGQTQGWQEWGGGEGIPTGLLVVLEIGPAFGKKSVKIRICQLFDSEVVLLGARHLFIYLFI